MEAGIKVKHTYTTHWFKFAAALSCNI